MTFEDTSSSTNATRILRHHCPPIYILLALVMIKTNDLVSIVVNIIAETLHGKIEKGSLNCTTNS